MTRGPRYNLHQIITFLEDPDVRLASNEEYKVDTETLGVLYAKTVSEIDTNYSPGIALRKTENMPDKSLQELQKRFQVASRNSLWGFLGRIQARNKAKAQQLRDDNIPTSFKKFAPGTIEYEVSRLARDGDFEQIGQALQQGARAYNTKMRQKGMPNYRFASEYTAILRALG